MLNIVTIIEHLYPQKNKYNKNDDFKRVEVRKRKKTTRYQQRSNGNTIKSPNVSRETFGLFMVLV